MILSFCLGLRVGAQSAVVHTNLPVLPPRKAPTELFRELLAASPEERQRQLAARSPAARALIENKLREFEQLPAPQREIRLRVAELQFFLSPLLQCTGERRAFLLGQSPAELQPLLEERLRAWDALPADRRRELVESERSLSWFVRLQAADARNLTNMLAQIPESQRAEAEAQFQRWQALTHEQRAQKTSDFRRFFELSDSEREKVLGAISPTERRQMEESLARFSTLPPDQRERAVAGFRRFLSLTAPDRAEFLQNIAQWQAMTPTERAAWRGIVERVTTPTPLPPSPRWTRTQLAGTNGSPP